MAKTGLFVRKQPGGVFTVVDETLTTGDIWFVDSGSSTGADSVGAGRNPDIPFLTVDFAINQATANQGDRIYVMPGHAENLTAVDTIDLDKAGIEIIGLGSGNDVPTFSATATGGGLTIDAASATLKNLKFVANTASGNTTALTLTSSADYCTLDGCVWRDTTTDKEWLIHASIATTVTDLTVKNCSFVTLAGSMTGSLVFAGASTNAVIGDNYFHVKSSDSVIDHQTTAAINIMFLRNIIVNVDTGTAGYCIECKTASTGTACDNRYGYNKVDAEVSLGDAMFWFENYGSNTIAQAGLLEPAAGAHVIP